MERSLHIGIISPIQLEIECGTFLQSRVDLGVKCSFDFGLAGSESRQTLGDFIARAEEENGAAERNGIAHTEDPQLDRFAIDLGSIGALQIGKHQAIVVILDLEVESANAFIVQLNRITLFAPDRNGGIQIIVNPTTV